jgi:hypothetical protein
MQGRLRILGHPGGVAGVLLPGKENRFFIFKQCSDFFIFVFQDKFLAKKDVVTEEMEIEASKLAKGIPHSHVS